jgi:hypothetical protein
MLSSFLTEPANDVSRAVLLSMDFNQRWIMGDDGLALRRLNVIN